MKTRRVLSRKAVQSRPPLPETLLAAVACDHWHAPGWVWGMVGCFFLFVWIGAFVSMAHEDARDIFAKEE